MVDPVGCIRKNNIEIVADNSSLECGFPFEKSSLLSIESIQKESFLKRIVKLPINLINGVWFRLKSFVGNYLFFCFKSCRDQVNWKETKSTFEKIYHVIITPNQHASSKDCKARFKEALAELSEEALERFKYHIGVKRAELADSSLTEAQKISWYEKNKESIDFGNDYFDKITGNTILEKAVESFWKEIKQHV